VFQAPCLRLDSILGQMGDSGAEEMEKEERVETGQKQEH
jgi:hypothetical protein